MVKAVFFFWTKCFVWSTLWLDSLPLPGMLTFDELCDGAAGKIRNAELQDVAESLPLTACFFALRLFIEGRKDHHEI